MNKYYKVGDIWLSKNGHYRIATECYDGGFLGESMDLQDYIMERFKLTFEDELLTLKEIINIIQDRMINQTN